MKWDEPKWWERILYRIFPSLNWRKKWCEFNRKNRIARQEARQKEYGITNQERSDSFGQNNESKDL